MVHSTLPPEQLNARDRKTEAAIVSIVNCHQVTL